MDNWTEDETQHICSQFEQAGEQKNTAPAESRRPISAYAISVGAVQPLHRQITGTDHSFSHLRDIIMLWEPLPWHPPPPEHSTYTGGRNRPQKWHARESDRSWGTFLARKVSQLRQKLNGTKNKGILIPQNGRPIFFRGGILWFRGALAAVRPLSWAHRGAVCRPLRPWVPDPCGITPKILQNGGK